MKRTRRPRAPRPPPRDFTRAAHAARDILDTYGLAYAAQAPIEELALARGLRVRTAPLQGAMARLLRVGSLGIVTVSDAITYAQQWRFTVFHELGHFELHGPEENQLGVHFDSDVQAVYDTGVEREANVFSSEIQMPEAMWAGPVRDLEPNLLAIEHLARPYQVSLAAASLRYVGLTDRRCAVAYCQGGEVGWWAGSSTFGHPLRKGSPLPPLSVAGRHHRGLGVIDGPCSLPAHTWLGPSASHEKIVEHCFLLPGRQATLALLWLPAPA